MPTLDPALEQRIAKDHPEAIILYHPTRKVWQFYERVHPDWTAERILQCIENYDRADRDFQNGLAFAPPEPWWKARTAPRIVGEWGFPPPGPWLLEALRRARFAERGGTKGILDRDQARRDEKAADSKRTIADLSHDAATTGHRHIADALRGDPLAGKRKWTQTVPADVKE